METTSILISLRFSGFEVYEQSDDGQCVEESIAGVLEDLVRRLRAGESIKSMHMEELASLGGRKVGVIYVDGA